MTSRDKYISILKENLPLLQQDFGVKGLAVFGSVARGDNTPESDIDLLVDMPPKILLISSLKAYLESILKISVDIIRRHPHLSQKFFNQISKDAIILL